MAETAGPILIIGDKIYTFDAADSVAEAILIDGGRVQRIGSANDLRASAPRGTRIIDKRGATIFPGLIDTHPHLLHFGSLAEPLVDLLDARSHNDIVSRIAERAKTTPPGEWIMTTPVGEPHYFIRRSYKDLAEGELPDRAVLDKATRRHPVVIQAWAPSLPNTIAFNSMALERLGLTRETPDRMSNVTIEKDELGEPTGRLHGSVTNYYSNDPFANELWLKIPFLRYEYLVPGTKHAISAYHRLGVTTVYENHMMDRKLIDAYRELRRDNALGIRVMASQEAESYGMPWSRPREISDFMARLEDAANSIELEDDWFRFDGVTIMWDGTCFPGGMMMREPYLGPDGKETCGYFHISPEKAELVMRFCAERRIHLNTMCMGNKAHEENLSRLERLAATHDLRSLRWLLVHAVFIEPEQVRRYARLNMDFTTSLSFCWGKGELFRRRMRNPPLGDLLPLRRFFDAGMAVAGASDWGPKNPFEQIELALTHEFAGSGYRNLGPDQRITRREAVSMWTRDAAKVLRWNGIGSLYPGAHADLVVVDRDLMTCDVEAIGSTKALLTLVGGKAVHGEL
ncbi:MAG TPA: amidohydrolase family protein [Alphaproteobacteria bacterium]|nr:amidohydrolase family protein [Alphaproteobacteria bacterium]